MTFVPAPQIMEMQFRTTWDGQQTMNRVHVDALAPVTFAHCQALATAGESWYEDNVVALVPSTLLLREVFVKGLDVVTPFQATATPTGPLPGTNVNGSVPNNVSICASIRTGLAGRSARGRWYWQGLTQDTIDNNTVQSGTLTDIDAALTNLASVIAGIGFNWVIVSYISEKAPRPGGPVYFSVTDVLFVDSIVDSQRRRLPGRGA